MAEKEYRQHRFTRPAGAAEIFLVRHGESAPMIPGRPAPRVDGHGDPALAPEGHEQARRVAERLAGHEIAAIYVTTLQRTVQTAAPLAQRLGVTPVVVPELREVYLGEWENEFRRHMADGDPIAVKMMAEERWDVIPGAEPTEDFSARISGALEGLAADHPDQRVVVVVHGGVIGELVRFVVGGGRGFAFVGCDNGSITHLVSPPAASTSGVLGRWVLRRYNDTSHLQAGFDPMPDPVPDDGAAAEGATSPAGNRPGPPAR